MPTCEDEAICIRHWDYSETSQTVGLFSKHHGLLRAIAKGSRRERAGFSGGVDLLTHADLVITLKPDSNLATLTQWSLRDNFPTIRTEMHANKIAYFAADTIGRVLESHDPHPNLFEGFLALLHTISQHSQTPQERDIALLEFQWLLLQEAGYQPTLGTTTIDVEITHFDPRDGGKVCDTQSATSWKVHTSTISILNHMRDGGREAQTTTKPEGVRRANRLLAAYLREIIGEEPFTMRRLFGVIPIPTL